MGGALTALESSAMRAADVRSEIRWLRHGVDVMNEITDDVLDIRALSLGKLKLSCVRVNLRALLEGCVLDQCPPPRIGLPVIVCRGSC